MAEEPSKLERQAEDDVQVLLCSECFFDQGLKLDAIQIGIEDAAACPNCRSTAGRKLTGTRLAGLVSRYFGWGTMQRSRYGAAPVVQINFTNPSGINSPAWLKADIELLTRVTGLQLFYYGPRLWMLGENYPLKALQRRQTRVQVIKRILNEYPSVSSEPGVIWYRIRRSTSDPTDFNQFDSPPWKFLGTNRFDSKRLPILYCSPDLELCIHECRVTAEDDLFVGSLQPTRALKLLDLTEIIDDKGTEFESLDIAMYMVFLASSHSYSITRAIARAARSAGFDGLTYPSYFSMLRTGTEPFETSYGISHRRFPQLKEQQRSRMVPNIAIFGRPIREGILKVACIDRVVLSRVVYGLHFGPVGV